MAPTSLHLQRVYLACCLGEYAHNGPKRNKGPLPLGTISGTSRGHLCRNRQAPVGVEPRPPASAHSVSRACLALASYKSLTAVTCQRLLWTALHTVGFPSAHLLTLATSLGVPDAALQVPLWTLPVPPPRPASTACMASSCTGRGATVSVASSFLAAWPDADSPQRNTTATISLGVPCPAMPAGRRQAPLAMPPEHGHPNHPKFWRIFGSRIFRKEKPIPRKKINIPIIMPSSRGPAGWGSEERRFVPHQHSTEGGVPTTKSQCEFRSLAYL